MEADIYKQQPGSWSRGPWDPEACPGGDWSRTAAQVWTLLGSGGSWCQGGTAPFLAPLLGAGPLYCAGYLRRQERGQPPG